MSLRQSVVSLLWFPKMNIHLPSTLENSTQQVKGTQWQSQWTRIVSALRMFHRFPWGVATIAGPVLCSVHPKFWE